MKTVNDASYEATVMSDQDRYWFKRDFCDLRHGSDRSILVSLEKTGLVGGESDLPWTVRIEDRKTRQTWKLLRLHIDGENKLIFERYIRSSGGVKVENFNLAFLPDWLLEELAQVALEMNQREYDKEGEKFVINLVEKAKLEKITAKSKLSAKVDELGIGGLYHILSTTRGDSRGSFREVARFPEIELLTGYDFVGKQVNHSVSSYGTLRGFHVEPWAKLVTVVSGLAVSYLLDTRIRSKTYGKLEKIYLGFGKTPDGEEVTGGALFIEPGIANSVLTLSEKLDYAYVVDDLWSPATALYAVNPMDLELGVPWESYVPAKEIIRSERDTNSPTFAEFTKTMKEKNG